MTSTGTYQKYIDISPNGDYKSYQGNTGGSTTLGTNYIEMSGNNTCLESTCYVPTGPFEPVIIRFACQFVNFGSSGSTTEIGIGNKEDGIFFAVNSSGQSFIKSYSGGILLKVRFTCTATAAGSFTATLGGVARPGTMIGSGVQAGAFSLCNAVFPYYMVNSSGAVATLVSPFETASDGTYSMAGTLSGTFSTLTSGLNPTINSSSFMSINTNTLQGLGTYELKIHKDRVSFSVFNTFSGNFTEVFSGNGFPVLQGLKPFMIYTKGSTFRFYETECFSSDNPIIETEASITRTITTNIVANSNPVVLAQISPNFLTSDNKILFRRFRITSVSSSGTAASGIMNLVIPTGLFNTNAVMTSANDGATNFAYWTAAAGQTTTTTSIVDTAIQMVFGNVKTITTDCRNMAVYIRWNSPCAYIVLAKNNATTMTLRWIVNYDVEI